MELSYFFRVSSNQALIDRNLKRCYDSSVEELLITALDSNSELLELLIAETTDYAIFALDRDGRVASWNPGAARIKGYRAEEIIGQHFSVLYTAEDVAAGKPQRGLDIAAANGRHEDEGWRIRKDGTLFWASVVITALHDQDGQLRGYGKVTRDLTERRTRELELHASEQATVVEAERAELNARLRAQADRNEHRIRQILDGAPDAMIISDSDGVIQAVNDQTLRLLGYTRDELTGGSVDSIVPQAMSGVSGLPRGPRGPGGERTTQDASRPSALAMTVERELMARHKDGSEIPVSVTLSPVHSDDGWLVVAAVRDTTGRHAEQARLQAAEERFRRAFDDAPIGMMIIGLDGRFIQVNDAFCAIVGHPREALIGLHRSRINHPDDTAGGERTFRDLVEGRIRTYSREKRYIHAAGHAVWASVSGTLVRDKNDQPLHLICQAQDITERRRYEDQLTHMADHDPLTGLLNRRSFERELSSHVSRIRRSGPIGAVLMVDLDNFKYYNDTQGHSAGDDLIVRIGQALKNRLRETDVLARLGGDEFAVLLSQADTVSAGALAESLLEIIRTQMPAPIHGESRRVTASIGIACFSDGDHMTGEEIMVNADLAMYEAKETGRNRIARYSTAEHDRPRVERRMKWAGEISRALVEDRFELFAQPIESLRSTGPAQYELLLRMRDGNGDHIPPGTFIYIAERLGIIQEIDRWVVARAIEMLGQQRALGRDLRFEINLSGHTIGDPEILELIERRLNETGIPADRLIFEITETAAVANIARAAAFADRLSVLGCRFALDDFGAGFGSFYYLKHLPFDYLKIDGEFVRHCATNETDRILISAVVQIAKGMGKRTIAEFVNDQETVDILTGLGVDYGQGYFLGAPRPLGQDAATPSGRLPAGTKRPA